MLAVVSWPILERIPIFGDVAISPHGIGIAAGVLLGGWMMLRRARQRGVGAPIDDVDEAVQNLLGWVLLGAIAGARGFYVLNNLDVYTSDPLAALAIWEGGLTLLGGITGGATAGLIVVRRRGWRPGLLLDAAAPGLAAGIAVGRLGDLAIGDHLGAPAPGNPLAWQCNGNLWERATNSFGFVAPQPYPSGAQPVGGCYDVPVIQTALFDVLAAAITVTILFAVERRLRQRTGVVAATFVLAYGTGRLLFDFLRGDPRYVGLTASQWTALTAIAAATVWLVWRLRQDADPDAVAGAGDEPTEDQTSDDERATRI